MNTAGYGYPGNGKGPDVVQFRIDIPLKKMKPCPFCGGTNIYTKQDVEGFWYVICDERGCRTKVSNDKYPYTTETEARDAWNRRASE